MKTKQSGVSSIKNGGEMGALVRALDWRQTAVGDPSGWPASLITTLNLLLNSKFPMFLFWGSDLTCFYNDAYRPSLGSEGKHPSILGMAGEQAWPEIWDVIKPMIDQVLAGGEPLWMENALIPIYRNNKIEDVYWTFSYSPAYDNQGYVAGVFVTCAETTAKVLSLEKIKQQEKTLLEKEKELVAITSASPAALWLTDVDGKITYINQTWINWTGKALEHHLDHGWLNSIHPSDREKIAKVYQKAFRTRSTFKYDIRILAADGSAFWSAARGEPVYHEGQFQGFAGSCMDITDRKAQEVIIKRQVTELEAAVEKRTRAIRLREKQLSQAHAMAKMGSWEWEFDSNNITWSPEMFVFWGYRPGEIIVDMEHVVKSTLPEDIPILEKAIEKVKQGKSTEFSYRRINKKGEIIHIQTRVEIRKDDQGNPIGAFGIDLDISKDKQNERDLNALNRELQVAREIAKMGTWKADYQQNTYEWSDDMYRLCGFEPGEIPLDLEKFGNVHPDDLILLRASHRYLEEVGEPIDFEFRRKHKDGRTLRLISKGEPVRNAAGEVFGAMGVNVDISELRLKEEQLKSSQTLNETLLQILPNVVYIYDLTKDAYEFSNRSIFSILGYDIAEQGDIYKKGALFSILHPDDHEAMVAHFSSFSDVKDESVSEIEYRCKNQDGSYQYLLSRDAVYERDGNGHVNKIIGIITDITDLRTASLELKAVNSLLSNKNRHLEQQILTEFSESFASYRTGDEFFQSLSKELADKSLMHYVMLGRIVHESDRSKIESFSLHINGKEADPISFSLSSSPFQQIIDNKGFRLISECQDLFPDDHTIRKLGIHTLVGYPLFDYNRNVMGLICLMDGNSITNEKYIKSLVTFASKRVEMELERLEKEKELSRKNLRLERQNDDLMSFNRVASHDLQEPLRKIQMFISRFSPKEISLLSPRSQHYLDRIHKASQRMQTLINDLLTFSRINQIDALFEECELNDILKNSMEDLSEVIQEKKAIIRNSTLPQIRAVPFQIQQLFYNIISNSLKYTKEGCSPEIDITAKYIVNPDQPDKPAYPIVGSRKHLEIKFSDKGIGFDQKYQEKIFAPFSRLHDKTDYPGTGIGLAICKKIVDNHQGKIIADSSAGNGTTVTVLLPS